MGFVPIDTKNVRIKFEVRIALPVPEITGGTGKISAVPGYAHAPFSKNFKRGFVPMEPMNVPVKFEVRSFTRSWDNRESTPQIWTVSGHAHAPFTPKFLRGFCSHGLSEYTCQI